MGEATTTWCGELGRDLVTGEIRMRCWDPDDMAEIRRLMADNFEAARAQGAAAERARIVAWLRCRLVRAAEYYADRIEAGDHMPEQGGEGA